MTSHLPTDISSEFYVDGSFREVYGGVDLAARVRGSDSIRITRGLADQQGTYAPTSMTSTLNNRDGVFSPTNPYSPLYGKIGRNLRFRTGVKKSNTWDEYLRMPDYNTLNTGQRMYTVDKASLDVTGDLDVRFEFTPNYTRTRRQSLCGKWNVAAASRSWFVEMRQDGTLALATSPDGTLGAALTNVTTYTVPTAASRMAIRVTLDVDNGAAGRVYTWYTSTSISGTWTQVATSTVAGTTSIFGGTTEVEVGSVNQANGPFTDSVPFSGKVHAFQLYNGIAGTLVADFNPTTRDVGKNKTWVDTCASPNTWLMSGADIRLASDRIRLSGEIASLPELWDVTNVDRWVPMTAASIGRRYTTNKGVLGSAIYRNYRNYPLLNGYWPCEDQAGATQAASALSDGRPGETVSCTFGSTSGLDGSAGCLTLSSAPNISSATFRGKTITTGTGSTTVLFYFKLDTLPASEFTWGNFYLFPATTVRIEFNIGPNYFSFRGYGSDNTNRFDSGAILFGATPLDQWVGMQIWLTQEGGNVRYQTAWHGVGTNTFFTHNPGGSTYAGTLGRGLHLAKFGTPDASFAGAQLAHVIMATSSDLDLVSTRFRDVSKGYAGETVLARMARLAVEENVQLDWLGDFYNTQICGPQQVARLVDNFTSAAAVDGGLFGDMRDTPGFRYVTRAYLGNRQGLTLNYANSELSATPAPITDDRYTVNDFTASRPSGSSARYQANDNRPLNVNDPDATVNPGVGRYEMSGSFNASSDSQLNLLASAQVAVGTASEYRIPNLAVGLHRSEMSASRIADTIACDFGDPLTLTGLNAMTNMAPDDVSMVAFGYTETISNFLWDWVSNTVPQAPYHVPIVGTYDTVRGEPRLDADFGGHVAVHCGPNGLSSGITSIKMRINRVDFTPVQIVDSTSYAAEFPLDLLIAGERMTMTACTAPPSSANVTPGDFEAGVTGFQAANCTLTQSSTFAFAGTFSGLMTASGVGTNMLIRTTTGNAVPVRVGSTYTFGAQVRSVVNLTDVRASVDFYDSSLNYITTIDSGVAALVSGAWTARSVAATAPANAAFALYGTTVFGSPAAGTLLYNDAFTFTVPDFWFQTGTMTRAANGVAKTIPVNSEIHLASPANLGLE